MARVIGVYEKGEAMTHIASGRSYRLVLAARAFAAFAISHPASAQDADHVLVASGGSEVVVPGAGEVTGTGVDGAWAHAKPAGSIVGTVHDPSGAPVTEVELTIKNLATDEILNRMSDASGEFSIQNVTPGSYEIRAQKSGFRETDATIVLAASQRLYSDFRLR